MKHLSANDLVYATDHNGNVQAGGFKVNSYLMKHNASALDVKTDSSTSQKGGGIPQISSILDGLAVPAGLLYLQQNYTPTKHNNSQDSLASSLYDKLVSLASEKTKNNTKKNKRTIMKPTSYTQKTKGKKSKTKRKFISIKKNKTKRN